VVDLAREMVLDDAKLQSRAKITPWHGRKVKGLPVHRWCAGVSLMRDRTLVEGTRGHAARCIRSTHGAPPRAIPTKTMEAILRVPAGKQRAPA